MNNLKLGVEVVSATNIMAKDGQGSSSSFVELHFDEQKFRSTTKEKDLNPVWNEFFYFNISNPARLPHLDLEAYIYNANKTTHSKSNLGKVRIAGSSFVQFSEAAVMHYPLEKHSIFSRVKGELGLKVFLTDDPSIKISNPLPAIDPFPNNPPPAQVHQAQVPITNQKTRKEKKSEERHTFHHLPKENNSQHYSNPVSVMMAEPPQMKFAADEMKADQPQVMRMFAASSSHQPADYELKETSPFLGGGRIVGGRVIASDKPSSTYDLVEQMQYLFVRVVKAKELPAMDATGSLDPYVEVKLGNYKGKTKTFEKKQNPEWNEVFAFARDRLQASVLEVHVKDKDLIKDDFVGVVRFDLNDVPTRVPPDSPLAPEWYRLENKKGEKVKGELMLAVWMGTQADECFPDAWHSDAVATSDASFSSAAHIRSKVYHAPRLWYVRVNVIEAQDVLVGDKTRFPDVFVRAQVGGQVLRTRSVQSRTANHCWNEDLMFVAAEPLEEPLIIQLEDRVGPSKEEVIGKATIHLTQVDRRLDVRPIIPRWYNLDKHGAAADGDKKDKFSSKIHLRVCLEGGYHVFDESTHYSSDLRPAAKQLWKPSIGILELGILGAAGIHPTKAREGKGTSDTYCVAKYGQKWVRTRTIIGSLAPKYNEQYTWEVYDHATVLTVGVFDNSQIGDKASNDNKDMRIGKVRIRLSTLQTGRVYTHSYPLLVLHPSGLKKMGELHLAIRFSSTSLMNTMHIYSRPLLPKMHYVMPLSVIQLDILRQQAVSIVAARLSRMEPPLRKEVVEYMSDVDSHLWSMRKSKANFFRLMSVFSSLLAVGKWFGGVCAWKSPITTVLVHVLFVMLACFPELILPTIFLYLFLIGLWNYRYRPRHPPHMNTKISHAEAVHPDELDEEFDGFPTTKNPELIKLRYDRLRHVAGKIQTVVGDIATQGERIQSLISWRDPRATTIFLLFCLMAALVLYVTPFQVVVVVLAFWMMRHPKFRHSLPSAPINFFRRLPARTDSML